jgi:hypothetical protein
MPDGQDSAAQTDEQDFSIPGQNDEADENQGGPSSAPPGATAGQTSPQQPANAAASPSTSIAPPGGYTTDDYDAAHHDAKVSGRAMFLGNLLRTILSGAGAGMASSGTRFGNAVKAGQQSADPVAQQLRQASVSKALSEADQAKIQTSITGMKALQYEYLLKRLPQDDQNAHLKSISDFKQNLIKEGASVEAEGDDEKASDAQAFHLNGTDPRATNHEGRFYSLPTMDSSGNAKFDTVYVPSKDTLQSDFKWTDGEGNEQTIPAGTPMSGALGKFVEAQQKSAQNQTKDQHKQLADALKPNVPEGEIPQTVSWLEDQQKQNTPLYQQNKVAVDGRISSLRQAQKETQAQKERTAAAGAARVEERGLKGKDVMVHTDDGDVVMSSKEAQDQGYDDFSTLTSTAAQNMKDKRANADASMDALNQYESTFRESAPKLSSSDRDSLRVLTSHMKADAGSGILGPILEQIPLVGPVGSTVNKIMEGTVTSDAYKSMSPEGKKMLSQYAMAIVANFANMKQMLGSVGRNPAMIQAEMAQIPLPYLDKESAQEAFTTKKDDLMKRNSSIPKVYNKRDEKLKKGLKGTERNR